MVGEWQEVELGEVAALLTGYPFKSEYYSDNPEDPRLVGGDNIVQGSLRWENIRRWPRHLVDGLEAYWLSAGDVLLAMDRPWIEAGLKRAAIGQHDLPALLVQRTARLRGTERLDAGFLRYVIGSREFAHYVLGVQTGTAVPHISPTQIRAFRFRLPPLIEQRAIAHVLGTLDEKMELNRRMNETLEAVARALFRSWFLDFEPIRAKAEGRDPGLPKAIADLFPDRLVESEMGKIPKGWVTGPVLNHADLLSGGTPKTESPDYWNGGIFWASAKDVSQCGHTFLITTERTITTKGLDESATQLIPRFSTVIVARGATTGRMVIFGREMAMNQTCYALVSKADAPFFLYCQLRQEIDALVHAAHGSVFDTITTSTFANSRVLLPPEPVLKAFEKVISPLLQRILSNTEESRSLTSLRDTLLPKLISGDLRVKAAEKFIRGGA